MHDHDQCEALIHDALAHRRDGWAEYLATRCDRQHGPDTAPQEDAMSSTHSPTKEASR